MYAVYGESRVVSESGGVVSVVIASFNERGVGVGSEHWGERALEISWFSSGDAE